MTTQLTIPPARVWDRIEKILDEQERRKNHTDKLISHALRKSQNLRYTNYFIMTVSSVGLLALLVFKFSRINHQSLA